MRAFNAAASLYWAIEEQSFQTILAVLSREMHDVDGARRLHQAREQLFAEYLNSAAKPLNDPNALHAVQGDRMEGTRRVVIRNKTAIVRIEGVLVRRADLFSEISGATSIERLAQDFTTALNSDKVENIVLYIDSPGGEVNGINEFAEMIFQARSKKRITAYSGGYLASGAYWLASAAEEITVQPTAIVGSIGVIAVGLDRTGMLAMNGVKEVRIHSSQSPKKDLRLDSQEGQAAIEQTVDALAEVFVNAVARNRGVTAKKVLDDFGGGGVLVGQAAVTAGLADKLGSFEEGLAEPQAPPQLPDAVPMDGKKKAENQQDISAADDEGDTMDWRKLFGIMSEDDRKAARAALASDDKPDNKATDAAAPTPPAVAQPAQAAQPPAVVVTEPPAKSAASDAVDTGTQKELERLRAESEEHSRTIAKMRAKERTAQAETFVNAQLSANKLVPAESDSLKAEYLQAVVDDEAHPVAEGSPTRVATIEARQEKRPAHLLTEEVLHGAVPKGAVVLTNKEPEDAIANAKTQAESYANERNQASRSASGASSQAVN
jgi:signal peptide peptidase SppA